MNDLQLLKDELASGHPITGEYSGDDAVAADQMNHPNITRKRPISSTELLAWSAQSSRDGRPRIIKIKEAAQAHLSEAVRAIAIVAELTITRDNTSLDLSLGDRVAMIDALVAGRVLSEDDALSLFEAAEITISRSEELGFNGIRAGTINQARNH